MRDTPSIQTVRCNTGWISSQYSRREIPDISRGNVINKCLSILIHCLVLLVSSTNLHIQRTRSQLPGFGKIHSTRETIQQPHASGVHDNPQALGAYLHLPSALHPASRSRSLGEPNQLHPVQVFGIKTSVSPFLSIENTMFTCYDSILERH
jgi:hypothetical protein